MQRRAAMYWSVNRRTDVILIVLATFALFIALTWLSFETSWERGQSRRVGSILTQQMVNQSHARSLKWEEITESAPV